MVKFRCPVCRPAGAAVSDVKQPKESCACGGKGSFDFEICPSRRGYTQKCRACARENGGYFPAGVDDTCPPTKVAARPCVSCGGVTDWVQVQSDWQLALGDLLELMDRVFVQSVVWDEIVETHQACQGPLKKLAEVLADAMADFHQAIGSLAFSVPEEVESEKK